LSLYLSLIIPRCRYQVTRFYSASFSTYTHCHSSLIETSGASGTSVCCASISKHTQEPGKRWSAEQHIVDARCPIPPWDILVYGCRVSCAPPLLHPSTVPLPPFRSTFRSPSALLARDHVAGMRVEAAGAAQQGLGRRGYLKGLSMIDGTVSLLIALPWQSPSSCRERSGPLLPPTPGPRSPSCCCCTMCSSERSESQSAC
jgi:hypothetical protein